MATRLVDVCFRAERISISVVTKDFLRRDLVAGARSGEGLLSTPSRPPPQVPSVGFYPTLMSALPSGRQPNPWLCFKRVFRAALGKAGGAVVEATVDHPLMRGSEPHDR